MFKPIAFAACLLLVLTVSASENPNDLQERWRDRTIERETEQLAAPFRGITIDGVFTPDLFTIESTGVSTQPVVDAAQEFIDSLDGLQRSRALFAVDDPEWRKWNNMHGYYRQGVSFGELSPNQKDRAFSLLKASMSPKGVELSRDIMRLNHTIGELNPERSDEYGEHMYWLSMMGEPSLEQPWGWQLDGHHLIINFFVLGDQVVVSPMFVGSEPVIATQGKYAGTSVLQDEQDQGLQFLLSLDEKQRALAVVSDRKDFGNSVGAPFKDNIDLQSQGVPVASFSSEQRSGLLDLVELYISNIRDGHARVRMAEIEQFLDETTFMWIGGTSEDSVYYYRITSPVVMIEFDHMGPVGLRHLYPDRRPIRNHIHAVVRTPNGNDYGKDLLRQHYERHAHTTD